MSHDLTCLKSHHFIICKNRFSNSKEPNSLTYSYFQTKFAIYFSCNAILNWLAVTLFNNYKEEVSGLLRKDLKDIYLSRCVQRIVSSRRYLPDQFVLPLCPVFLYVIFSHSDKSF